MIVDGTAKPFSRITLACRLDADFLDSFRAAVTLAFADNTPVTLVIGDITYEINPDVLINHLLEHPASPCRNPTVPREPPAVRPDRISALAGSGTANDPYVIFAYPDFCLACRTARPGLKWIDGDRSYYECPSCRSVFRVVVAAERRDIP